MCGSPAPSFLRMHAGTVVFIWAIIYLFDDLWVVFYAESSSHA